MRNTFLLTALLLAGLLLPPGCAATTSAQDKALTQLVDETIKPNHRDVWAMAVNGTVYLDGTVSTFNEKRNVEETVRAMPGVKDVKSRIGIPDLEDARDKDKRGGYL